MHTPVDFYVVLPDDLYRLGGRTRAKFDYVRTTPPRAEAERWDVRLYDLKGVSFVDAQSGGLSLFNFRNAKLGTLWWRIPKGTNVPLGLQVSRDAGADPRKAHFTVRPLHDTPHEEYLQLLRELEALAVPCFLPDHAKKAG
jgi:hypothetical protein